MVTLLLRFLDRNPVQRTQQLSGDEAFRPVAPAPQDHPYCQQRQLGKQEGDGEVL